MTTRETDPPAKTHKIKVFWLRTRGAIVRTARGNPILIALTLAIGIAAIGLVLVLDEQSKGRDRDRALTREALRGRERDRQIKAVFEAAKESRVQSVRISCRLNASQNAVLLSLITFSVRASRDNPQPGLSEAERKRLTERFLDLLEPITPSKTQKVCDALLKGAQGLPLPQSTPNEPKPDG